MVTQQQVDAAIMGNGWSYAKLDLAKVLLALHQEGGYDQKTLNEVSDRMEHIYQMRQATNFALPIEIIKGE